MKKQAMTRAAVALLALALCLLGATTALAQGLTKIADNVYSYVDVKNPTPQNAFAANAGIVVGSDAVLVVDTLMSAKQAERFIADIKAVTDKPIKYVVNTHYHWDHSQGNSAFAKLGAVIISHVADRASAIQKGEANLKRAAAYGMTPEELEGTSVVVPQVAFTDKLEIDLGGQLVQLLYPKASHTTGSIVVWVGDKKALFTGDLLFNNFHPFLAEGDLKSWAMALDFCAALGAEKIIPGHGPLSTNADLQAMKKYLATFDAKAKKLSAKIKDPDQLAAALKKELPAWENGEFLIKGNLMMRYMKK